VDCPGLFFSCSMLNLSIEDCYNQGNKFTAIIKAQGLSQSPGTLMKPDEVISYTLKTKQTYFLGKGDSLGEFLIEEINEGKITLDLEGQKVEMSL